MVIVVPTVAVIVVHMVAEVTVVVASRNGMGWYGCLRGHLPWRWH